MAKSPVTGWRACELEQRAGKSTCIQPPYRHRGGCNSVAAPCRCPIARTCCHEPNCRLQARPSPSYPYLLHRQPFATNRTQARSIMHPQFHAKIARKVHAKGRTRNGSQHSYSEIVRVTRTQKHMPCHSQLRALTPAHTRSQENSHWQFTEQRFANFALTSGCAPKTHALARIHAKRIARKRRANRP
jgi:hypothetical protein